jgi:hypothetical protein
VKKSYDVRAIWDEENEIWYSESDLIGLHVEAKTFPEFQEMVHEFAAELIVTNHYCDEDLEQDLRDLIPAIVISQSEKQTQAA